MENRRWASAVGIDRSHRHSSDAIRGTTGVAERLGTYVYRLIDPRNGETFYVSKGQGNRLFAHIHEQVKEDDEDNKLRRIRAPYVLRALKWLMSFTGPRNGRDD